MTHPRRRVKRSHQSTKPLQKAAKPPERGAETPRVTSSERSNRKSRSTRLSADQIEMLEKLLVLALGAIEPADKLVHALAHMIH